MHESVVEFVGRVVEEYDLANLAVLEVGSRYVNGTNRDHFCGDYFGIDRQPGDCVDAVADIEEWTGDADERVVVCTEMLEHTPKPVLALTRMYDCLRSGGYLILTTRSEGFPKHDPPDYYRFELDYLSTVLEQIGFTILEFQKDPQAHGVFFLAEK